MQEDSLALLFGSAFISSTIAPGGSEAVLAYMVAAGKQSLAVLVVVATIGNTLGAITTWGLGVFAAKKYPAEKVLSERKQKSIVVLRKWGGWALLFSWLPVIGDGLCFAGGWLRMSIVTSIAAILVGKAARYALIAYASTALV
ncbi:YqaA family protein [Methylomarinum sp. Ch1-1]|uniref:YqaA family protein n=1 Tax=Methylomarinum roseum TaxID=3067653 RepID=A0AAU7NVT6_9GAMM